MKDLEKIYNENYNEVYDAHKSDYFRKKEFARDVKHILNKAFNELDEKRNQLSKNSFGFNLDSKKIEIKNIMNEDNRITTNEALNLVTKDSKGLQKNIIIALSTKCALEDFNTFLRDEHAKFFPIQEIEELENQNKVMTSNRQMLANYYLLTCLDIEWAFVPKTDIAKAIHLISGTDIPIDKKGNENIDNSTIYKKSKKIFDKKDKKSFEDLQFILKFFQKIATNKSIGLNNVIQKIQSDIEGYREK